MLVIQWPVDNTIIASVLISRQDGYMVRKLDSGRELQDLDGHSRIKLWMRSLCCTLGQDTLPSQCLTLPRYTVK